MRKPSMIPYYASSSITLLRRFRPISALLRLIRGRGDELIRIPDLNLELHARDFMDVWSIKETFCDNDYEVYGFAIEPGWTVVDIGAATGDFTIHAARDFRAGRVIAVEPDPSALPILRANLLRNQVSGVAIVDKAISNSSTELWLDTSGDPVSMGTATEQGSTGASVQVAAITLRELLDENGVERCDLLKIDCEGGEYDILLGANDDDLSRIQRIVMEFHEGRSTGHATRRELAARLEAADFKTETFESKVHTDLGYIRATR